MEEILIVLLRRASLATLTAQIGAEIFSDTLATTNWRLKKKLEEPVLERVSAFLCKRNHRETVPPNIRTSVEA